MCVCKWGETVLLSEKVTVPTRKPDSFEGIASMGDDQAKFRDLKTRVTNSTVCKVQAVNNNNAQCFLSTYYVQAPE